MIGKIWAALFTMKFTVNFRLHKFWWFHWLQKFRSTQGLKCILCHSLLLMLSIYKELDWFIFRCSLNNTLLNCKSFKFTAISIYADDTELKHLAKIYRQLIRYLFGIMSRKKSFIRSVQRLYKYYDNVLLCSSTIFYEESHFLVDLTWRNT